MRHPHTISISSALSLSEAAAYTRKSRNTLLAWIHAGRLKASRTSLPRGNWIFFPEDLDAAQRWTPAPQSSLQQKAAPRGF